MTHKTIARLVEKARKTVTSPKALDYADQRSYPVYTYKYTQKEGREVWAVEYNDGIWSLWHYGTRLLTVEKQVGGFWTVEESRHVQKNGISVSDQQGMNGFLRALGAPAEYYVSRAGRTADYGLESKAETEE